MTTPKVSIIIPVFNRLDLTKQVLAELRGSTEVPHEVIIVDNASSDGTRDYVMSLMGDAYPNLGIRFNDVNYNFSGGCNQGAEMAKGEYLCFLNNDTIPFTGWLEPLVAEMEKPDVAIAGSKLVFPDGTIQHAGVAFMRETRFPYHPYRGADGTHPYVNHRRELQVVTGACLMVKRDWFNKCGQFNPDYINGGEDIELCLKARRLGGKVIYQPESALIHLESQSPGRLDFNEKNIETFFRNFQDSLLSDEDAFYFEDGLHRVGPRISIHFARLEKFESEQNHQWWSRVAQAQTANANGDTRGFLEAINDTENWPVDAAVREWAAFTCNRMKLYDTACRHFITALQVHSVEARQQALSDIASKVSLAPQFNPFYK